MYQRLGGDWESLHERMSERLSEEFAWLLGESFVQGLVRGRGGGLVKDGVAGLI